MSDRLGEAREWLAGALTLEPEQRLVHHREAVEAAARSWHTLTNPTDELIERIADAIMDEPGFEWQGLNDPEVKDHLTLTCRDAARAAVDALTDTAEPGEEH